MSFGTLVHTWLFGELVGADQFGNRYYREKGRPALVKGGGMPSRERRWVLYDGTVEASRVPPQWHAWLHHTVDAPPVGAAAGHAWQKEHQPNLTGTAAAYRPPGSLLRGGHRAPTTGDYEPWRPE